MTFLENALREDIKTHGKISLYSYMARCLCHAYDNGSPIVGKRGHFITSPEISQLMGEMLAIWIVGVILKLPKGVIHLVELGPGNGVMMADILRTLRPLSPHLSQASIKVHMVESSALLIKQQKEALKAFKDDFEITWGATWPKMDSPGIILAHEFFDALPIQSFRNRQDTWQECYVSLGAPGNFQISWEDARSVPRHVQDHPLGVVDFAPDAQAWMSHITKHLKEYGGGALVIDYGDDVLPGHVRQSTLQALCNHKSVDVFYNPGDADLTAHVDFGYLRYLAEAANMREIKYMAQNAFLAGQGIHHRLLQLCTANPDKQEALKGQYARLMHDMGHLFKVLEVFHGSTDPKL